MKQFLFTTFALCCLGLSTLDSTSLFADGQKTPQPPAVKPQPPVVKLNKVPVLETILELNIGQTETVTLTDKSRVTAKLVSIKEVLDPAVKALRQAQVSLEINGKPLTLVSGTYRRPITFDNVQIDVPIVMNYVPRNGRNVWGIAKDARLRMWPKNSPLTPPGTFVYPVKQKHFATSTQMNNEPVFVDGGERPGSKTQYYHNGLDFGGCEGEIEVVAATDSVVVSSGLEFAPGHEGTPVSPRYDVIYALDGRGWYYRYSHLKTIAVKVGDRITAGQVIGILGKEAGSGGWSHLHFGVSSNVPNGQWGDLQSYPFVWEAYVNQYKPKVIACARPHIVGVVGKEIQLNGDLSWSACGNIASYEWTCSNGKVFHGAKA
ncbi:MAG: M23 family metallopeptidase, partial [Thermoguttaceae bacterium]|nr:M23 family metallopeptidase [Thermoguttaceae bacterium]